MMAAKEIPVPQCETSERAMLGCIVSSAGQVLDEIPLTVEHFFVGYHPQIFGAVEKLHKDGKQIDQFTVQAEMGAELCGKIGYANLSDWLYYPSPAMAKTFHDTLCDKLSLRRVQAMGIWMQESARTERDATRLCAEVDRRCATLPATASCDNLVVTTADKVIERMGRIQRGEKAKRMLTPIGAWNRCFGGLTEGQFYALASRPGLGKTALMEQMVEQYIVAQRSVLVFEKDMSPQMLIERICCRTAKVPYWKLSRELLNAEECKRISMIADALKDSSLTLYSPVGLTAEMMCSIIRREVRTKRVEAVFLDHIQALRFPGRDIREGLTASSLCIRACVTDTGVPHVVLAHLNRDGSKGRPSPENIKEFDQLFGDVDALALLWSDVEAADVAEGDKRPMKLYAAKNRGGAVAEEELFFDGPMLSFT